MRTLLINLFILSLVSGHAQVASLNLSHTMDIDGTPVRSMTKKVQITVKDMKSKEVIPFFTVDFTSCGHPVYESNDRGLFSMETVEGFACFIRIAKRGYANLDLLIDYSEIPNDGKTYNVFLSRSPNSFTGHVRDTLNRNLYLAHAKIELRSLQNKHVQRVESNPQGEFSLYLTPDTDYELFVHHPDYHPYELKFSTQGELDGREIRRLYVSRIENKRIPSGIGAEIAVSRKEKKLEGINYYSIQILAKQSADIDLSVFTDLEQFGEVFVEKDGLLGRVKVGKFFDRTVAERMLGMIRLKDRYQDAFLTQVLAGNKHHAERQKVIFVREEGFMVRLASYLNPEMFDGSKIRDLGKLTSVQKNEWTVMLLSGYESLDEAKIVAQKVKDLGFKSAHVVHYNGTKLEKVE